MISQKGPSEPCPDSRDAPVAGGPSHDSEPTEQAPATDGPDLVYSDFTSIPNPPTTGREDSAPARTSHVSTTTLLQPSTAEVDTQAPAAKRRRVEILQQKSRPAQSPTPYAGANVPIPTTETNEVVPEASGAGEIGSVPSQPRAKTSIRPAQTKRRQEIEDAAAAIVTDATRSPSAKTKNPRKNVKGKSVQSDHGDAPGIAAGSSQQQNSQNDQDAAPAKPKKKYTKRKANQTIQDAAAEIVEDAIRGSTKDPKKRGQKSRRAVTPEGADAVRISPSEVKMSDLCKDSRTGRKSEREKDLAEFERAEFVRKKQRQLQEVMGQGEPENQGSPSESAETRLERLGRRGEREESIAENVPNTIIVDGQIQIDEDSLQIDRHAAAAAERDAEQLEAVDETDLTRKINSASWLKRDKSGGWNEMLTERFYEGLRMFGTDFEMISKMFPGRTRHKIKLKFVKEEKINHDKIKATLLGEKLAVDLPEYEKMAGVEFDDPKELERDLEEDRIRLEEETLAEKQAMDDARKERDEQISAERAAVGEEFGEESSAKENRRGKNKKRKNWEKHKGKKGSSKGKERHANRAGPSGSGDVLGELGEMLGL